MADLGLQDRPPIPQSKALASGLPPTVDSGMLCGTDTLPYRRLPLSTVESPKAHITAPLKSGPDPSVSLGGPPAHRPPQPPLQKSVAEASGHNDTIMG